MIYVSSLWHSNWILLEMILNIVFGLQDNVNRKYQGKTVPYVIVIGQLKYYL